MPEKIVARRNGTYSRIPQDVIVTSELLAASVDKWVFIADAAYEVVLIKEIHSVVGGVSAAVGVEKTAAASATAPGAGTLVTTATIDLTTAVDTVQTPALVTTASTLQLAAGDKLGLDFSGTLTGLVGVIQIHLKALL